MGTIADLKRAWLIKALGIASTQYASEADLETLLYSPLRIATAPIQGTGSPEGVITAPVGTEYVDTAAGVKYIKTSGSGNTGWLQPLNAGRIAAAVNATGVVTTLPPNGAGGIGAIQTIPSTAISVTNSSGRPVVIRFGATFDQSVAGAGGVFFILRETTGAGADLKVCIQPITGSATFGNTFVTAADECDIGVVTTTRTFELRAHLLTPSGVTPTVKVYNSATAPTWIRADAA